MASRFIKQVRVTGADDSMNYYDMFEITRRFPFVEWGILLSKSSEGYPRFPTWQWLSGLIAERPPEMNLSGHLCGMWVRDIVDGRSTFLEARRPFVADFKRFQLNFHGQSHVLRSVDKFIEALVLLTGVHKQQVILQMDGVNDLLFYRANSLSGRHRGIDAAPLFDLSGGAGVLPEKWPEPADYYCGYAGGLSADNLEQELSRIADVTRKKDGSRWPIWIDAETHLRSNDDKTFDLAKVV